jgi:hypothetical protein
MRLREQPAPLISSSCQVAGFDMTKSAYVLRHSGKRDGGSTIGDCKAR